ncbi:hypothetical protein FTV88_2524 [Heliorestis convoluta]|uniref:Uncharacterized protein n=1 Tax=Heliorestis convoluta TaxID=356322 RepID=A0A5Q2N1D5_9FIRM|nr:hypothetical protein FTV88_2524 [Heliorestis convoluta]
MKQAQKKHSFLAIYSSFYYITRALLREEELQDPAHSLFKARKKTCNHRYSASLA